MQCLKPLCSLFRRDDARLYYFVIPACLQQAGESGNPVILPELIEILPLFCKSPSFCFSVISAGIAIFLRMSIKHSKRGGCFVTRISKPQDRSITRAVNLIIERRLLHIQWFSQLFLYCGKWTKNRPQKVKAPSICPVRAYFCNIF